jgi:predicted DNA-binding protein (UPF0251 family)
MICRRIGCRPAAGLFKPAGIPASALEEINLTVDELEALRLADLDGLYHAKAAARMGVSRQTFGNILESARRKSAECLVYGRALRIHGGQYKMNERRFVGGRCGFRGGVRP